MPARAATAEGDDRERLWGQMTGHLAGLRRVPGAHRPADPDRRLGARRLGTREAGLHSARRGTWRNGRRGGLKHR